MIGRPHLQERRRTGLFEQKCSKPAGRTGSPNLVSTSAGQDFMPKMAESTAGQDYAVKIDRVQDPLERSRRWNSNATRLLEWT